MQETLDPVIHDSFFTQHKNNLFKLLTISPYLIYTCLPIFDKKYGNNEFINLATMLAITISTIIIDNKIYITYLRKLSVVRSYRKDLQDIFEGKTNKSLNELKTNISNDINLLFGTPIFNGPYYLTTFVWIILPLWFIWMTISNLINILFSNSLLYTCLLLNMIIIGYQTLQLLMQLSVMSPLEYLRLYHPNIYSEYFDLEKMRMDIYQFIKNQDEYRKTSSTAAVISAGSSYS